MTNLLLHDALRKVAASSVFFNNSRYDSSSVLPLLTVTSATNAYAPNELYLDLKSNLLAITPAFEVKKFLKFLPPLLPIVSSLCQSISSVNEGKIITYPDFVPAAAGALMPFTPAFASFV